MSFKTKSASGLGIVAAASIVLIGSSGVASANTGHNSSQHRGATGRCSSGSGGCLYWGSNASGAAWATPSTSLSVANLAGINYANNGQGGGTPVKNNAASAENISSEYTFYVFYNENFSGNYDYLSPHTWGNLSYALNNDASEWLQ